jgi:hypothetical protein
MAKNNNSGFFSNKEHATKKLKCNRPLGEPSGPLVKTPKSI